MHSGCLTCDALFGQRCDCGAELEAAVRGIGESGYGALLHFRQEGRGLGLPNKVRAYRLHKRPGLGISSDKSGRLKEWRQQVAICPYTGKTGYSLGDCAAASRWVAAYRQRRAPHPSAVKLLTDVLTRPPPTIVITSHW